MADPAEPLADAGDDAVDVAAPDHSAGRVEDLRADDVAVAGAEAALAGIDEVLADLALDELEADGVVG